MMRIIKSSPSLWALVAAVVLFLLQVLPIPGVFLMMFGAGLITVLLIHVALISLFVEAAIGRLPRVLMIVPVAAYGAYYVAYVQEGREIAERAAALRASNPGKVFDFNPQAHSVVGKEMGSFVQTHDIPVVYEPNTNYKPENYSSVRLMRRDQCDAIKRDTQNRILITYVSGKFHLCVLRFPEDPSHAVVTVSRPKDAEIWKRKPGVSESLTEIVVDGKILGSYRSGIAWRLPVLPMGFIGCSLISSKPAWECGAQFLRKFQTLDTVPDSIDKARYDTPESIMLGVRKYTATDLANFKGFAQNEAVLARTAEEPGRVYDEAFEVLQQIVSGQMPKQLPWAMAYTLAQNPGQLVPLAQKMAARFAELQADRSKSGSDSASVLQSAIVTLPQSAFQPVATAMFDIVSKDKAKDDLYAIWRRYPALYVRAADAGPDAFPFYKQDFFAGKMNRTFLRNLPVLAICRIGTADAETIAEMQRRFLSSADEYNQYGYKTALVVALKKIGQDDFLKAHGDAIGWRDRDWFLAVMEGKGETSAGPNNCMAKEWDSTGFLGPAMRPSLSRMRDGWSLRAAK